MAFFDAKNPDPFVKAKIDEVRELIDQVNRGEVMGEYEKIKLLKACIHFSQVRALINPVGRKILTGDINELPI